jgi:hypothetical protein
MADDIADWVPDEQLLFDANPIGVAECLVNTDRRIVSWMPRDHSAVATPPFAAVLASCYQVSEHNCTRSNQEGSRSFHNKRRAAASLSGDRAKHHNCTSVLHRMSISCPKQKKKRRTVSWGKQWVWKEGEEEQTRSKRITWKKKRKERRDTIMVERDEAEQQDREIMEVRWAFSILKDRKLAKYVIFACTEDINALLILQLFLLNSGIKLEEPTPTLPQALNEFRRSGDITLIRIMANTDWRNSLWNWYRVKIVRKVFKQPADHISSTDTDESSRGRAANVALVDEGVVTSFIALPAVLRLCIMDYTPAAALLQALTSDDPPDDGSPARAAADPLLTSDDHPDDLVSVTPKSSS